MVHKSGIIITGKQLFTKITTHVRQNLVYIAIIQSILNQKTLFKHDRYLQSHSFPVIQNMYEGKVFINLKNTTLIIFLKGSFMCVKFLNHMHPIYYISFTTKASISRKKILHPIFSSVLGAVA